MGRVISSVEEFIDLFSILRGKAGHVWTGRADMVNQEYGLTFSKGLIGCRYSLM